jgi:hypothetical protein
MNDPALVRRVQSALNAHGYALQVDGIFGEATKAALLSFQTGETLQPTGLLDPDTRKALFEDRHETIFSRLGTLLALFNLVKGTPMTSDQLTGLVRTILASLLAYVAGKGWIPNASPELVAALTTVVVAVWSWVSNRPKTISKL